MADDFLAAGGSEGIAHVADVAHGLRPVAERVCLLDDCGVLGRIEVRQQQVGAGVHGLSQLRGEVRIQRLHRLIDHQRDAIGLERLDEIVAKTHRGRVVLRPQQRRLGRLVLLRRQCHRGLVEGARGLADLEHHVADIGEAGRERIDDHERHLGALRHGQRRAHGIAHRAANDADHALRCQALHGGDGTVGVRGVVGFHQVHLGGLEATGAIHLLERELDAALAVAARLGVVAGQGQRDAKLDFRGARRLRDAGGGKPQGQRPRG